MQRGLALLITSAVPQRYPKLRFEIVEGGNGWIAAQLRFMDYWWEDHHRWMEPKQEELPSFYFKRQFWATFEDDRAGILTRHLLGVDRLMWGSDYPHTEGTFPFSIQRIQKDFVDVPENETRMMVRRSSTALSSLLRPKDACPEPFQLTSPEMASAGLPPFRVHGNHNECFAGSDSNHGGTSR